MLKIFLREIVWLWLLGDFAGMRLTSESTKRTKKKVAVCHKKVELFSSSEIASNATPPRQSTTTIEIEMILIWKHKRHRDTQFQHVKIVKITFLVSFVTGTGT